MTKRYCAHCEFLSIDRDGKWRCDKLDAPAQEVETCPETGEKSKNEKE